MAIGNAFGGFKAGTDATNIKKPMMSVIPKTTPKKIDNKSAVKKIQNSPTIVDSVKGFLGINKKETKPVQKLTPSTMPKQQMMSYNIKPKDPSSKYLGLEKSEEKKLDERIDATGVQGEDKKLLTQEALKTFMRVKQSKAFLADRENTRQKIITGEMSSGDKEIDNTTYKTSQFADLMRNMALSSGVESVLGVKDEVIIQKALGQRPDLQGIYDKFLAGESDIIDVNMEIKGQDKSEKKDTMGAFEKKMANMVRKITGKEEISSEKRDMLVQDGKVDSFSKIAMDDLGKAPSVLVGAATVPAKQVAHIAEFGAKKLAGIDLNWSDGVDKLVEKSGVKQDGWFKAGQIATELGLTAIETAAGMGALKIGQLGALISKTPKIAKFIAKPVLEAIGFTAAGDLYKGKASSLKTYGRNIVTNVAFTSALSAIKSIRKGISLTKAESTAAKSVDAKQTQKIINETRKLKADFKAKNPLENINSEMDNVVENVNSDKGVIGEKLGAMRDRLKTVSYSIDDDVATINKALHENGIGATITKNKKGLRQVSSKISKSSGKGTSLTDIINSLNETTEKSLGYKGKLAALDKVNQDILRIVKTTEKGTQLGNSLVKASKEFSPKIEAAIEGYGFKKGEYAELAELRSAIKAFSSEGGDKSVKLLSKIMEGGTSRDTIKLFDKLKELGYTSRDLASEAFVTNKIMREILSPSAFEQAISGFYPSKPGAAMGGMTVVRGLIKKPVKRMLQSGKGYKDLQAFKNRTIGGKKIDMGKRVGGTKGQRELLDKSVKSQIAIKARNKNQEENN